MNSFARLFRMTVAATALALSLVPSMGHAEAGAKTLRFIPQADLRSIDPIWTTAYVTRNFGYLVFDTLFSLDKDFKPQPQMVDRWTASDDKLTYRFILRDGLKWHDGQPVRAADCVASLERWGKRDTLGQKLMEAVGQMKAVDDKTFTIRLKSPFPLILDALGKLSSNASAVFDSGTRCGWPAFMRGAAIVHMPASRSTSRQRAPITSPDRAAVRIANSSARSGTPSRCCSSDMNAGSSA